MAGEAVDLKIRAYVAKHRCGYIEAYNAVVHADEPDEAVRAYKQGAPGISEHYRSGNA